MEWWTRILPVLAVQEGSRQGGMPDLAPLFVWIGVVVLILVIAGAALMLYRRRVLGSSDLRQETGLMEDLRAMRDRGEISEQEFRSIRQTMVRRAREGQTGDATRSDVDSGV